MDQFKTWDIVIIDWKYKWVIHKVMDNSKYNYDYIVIIENGQYMSLWHCQKKQLTSQKNENSY